MQLDLCPSCSRVIKSKHILMDWNSHARRRQIAVFCNQSTQGARRLSGSCAYDSFLRWRTHPQRETVQPRWSRTVAGLTVRDGSAAENVMPFSRQPWVIRLLYPQCSEGTLLLSLPSLIISSCKPSCKSQHSRSARNDLGWLREGGSMSPFSKVLLNGEVMVKRKLATGVRWGLLFRHDMRRYQKSEGAGVEKEEEACGWVLPPGRYYLQLQAMISLVMMAAPDGIVRWESGLLREHLTLFTSPRLPV